MASSKRTPRDFPVSTARCFRVFILFSSTLVENTFLVGIRVYYSFFEIMQENLLQGVDKLKLM